MKLTVCRGRRRPSASHPPPRGRTRPVPIGIVNKTVRPQNGGPIRGQGGRARQIAAAIIRILGAGPHRINRRDQQAIGIVVINRRPGSIAGPR